MLAVDRIRSRQGEDVRPSATVCYFAGAGIVGGAAAALFLMALHNPDYRPAVPGRDLHRVASLYSVAAYSLLAGVLGGLWASILESRAGHRRVGFVFGCAVAALAFVTLIVLIAAYETMALDDAAALRPGSSLEVFLGTIAAYVLAGGVLFGWALVALGGATGWLARRHAERAPAMIEAFRKRLDGFDARIELGGAPLMGLLPVVELLIAPAVGFAVGRSVFAFGCRNHSCYDLQALGPFLAALPAAVVTGIVYLLVVMRMKRPGFRLIWDGTALALAAVAILR